MFLRNSSSRSLSAIFLSVVLAGAVVQSSCSASVNVIIFEGLADACVAGEATLNLLAASGRVSQAEAAPVEALLSATEAAANQSVGILQGPGTTVQKFEQIGKVLTAIVAQSGALGSLGPLLGPIVQTVVSLINQIITQLHQPATVASAVSLTTNPTFFQRRAISSGLSKINGRVATARQIAQSRKFKR